MPMPDVVLQSAITCPECGHTKLETMPTDACQYFYECTGCGAVLKPKQGDCCVFCSYGSVLAQAAALRAIALGSNHGQSGNPAGKPRGALARAEKCTDADVDLVELAGFDAIRRAVFGERPTPRFVADVAHQHGITQ